MVPKTEQSPERLDPQEHRGGLIVSEHRGRYLWAAQLATGLRVLDAGCGTGYGTQALAQSGASHVTGIDVSEEAVAHAAQLSSDERVEIVQGDLRALPFADGEFDLVVCFEVIEHVQERDTILDELARVVDKDGVLCISTPNRNVYPPGNPYHLHEYEPEELEAALGERFANVRLARQTAWLASAILSDAEYTAAGAEQPIVPRTVKAEARNPGEETFTIALAGRGELPNAESLLALGEPFEVRWWETQLDEAELQQEAGKREAAERERERAEQGSVMLDLESELAQAQNEIAQLRVAQDELKEWAQERMRERDESKQAERDRKDFENRLRQAERTIGDITGSLSWRITTPLRSAKRLFSGD